MRKRLPAESRVWLIGGGIASLAAAVFLIRDGGVRGEQIRILEESGVAGGSLDGSGDVEDGYLIRGGRMFEPHFECTHDLLRSIPSLASPGKSVSEEILEFTARVVSGRGSSPAPSEQVYLSWPADAARLHID